MPPDDPIPEEVLAAAELTPYAVEGRYPGFDDLLERQDQDQAVQVARNVIAWAERIINA